MLKILEGDRGDEEECEDIYDVLVELGTEVSDFSERLDRLEDKMNIIIKLLGKE